MSLVRNGYALSTRREFLGTLFSAFLGLALFDPSLATAQQGKEIKLTEKHIQSFMAAYNDMVKVYESADPDKPDDPKLEAQAEAIAKKNGFASLAEFDDVSVSISAKYHAGAKVFRQALAAYDAGAWPRLTCSVVGAVTAGAAQKQLWEYAARAGRLGRLPRSRRPMAAPLSNRRPSI